MTLDAPPPRAPVVGFWDYVWSDEGARIVQVDTDGAGRISCATTAGDMLRHLQCPIGGPCVHGGATT